MAPSTRDLSFCAVSTALGAWAFVKTQALVGPTFEPIMASCQALSAEEFSQTTEYHAYNPYVGLGVFNVFVCLLTQFASDLTKADPGGMLVWMTTISILIPLRVFIMMEAGRKDAKGPIRYPLVIAILDQLFGSSVIFSLIWVPSYILGRGTGGVSLNRVYASVLNTIPFLVLSLPVFWLDPDSALWTACAGILVGPAIAFPMASLWAVPGLDPTDQAAAKKSAEMSTMAYAAAGIMAIATSLSLVFITIIPTFGFNLLKVYSAVWGEANESVKFMTVDAIVLWLGGLIVIAYQKHQAAVEAFGLSFFFGPGAGTALVLAGLQVDEDAPTDQSWPLAPNDKVETKKSK